MKNIPRRKVANRNYKQNNESEQTKLSASRKVEQTIQVRRKYFHIPLSSA